MKKTKTKLMIGIMVVTICAASLYISLIYQYKPTTESTHSDAPKVKTKPFPIPAIPTGSGDQNDPKTWTRYTYNHDFSMSYPPYWNVVLDQDGNGVRFMTTGFHQDDDFTMPYGNSNEVVYTIFGQNDTSDIKLQNGDQFPSDNSSETMVVKNLKYIQIDNFPAVEFDYYPTDNINFLRTRISILKGNKIYQFNAIYAQDTGKRLTEEMVQSLQFLQN